MPDYENELWEHQKSCIAQANEAVKKGENAAISLPPGAGKSRMLLEVVKEFLSAKNEVRVLIAANRRVLLYSVIATPHIVSKDIATGSLNVNNFDLIIIDEVRHSIKFSGGAYKRSSNYQ